VILGYGAAQWVVGLVLLQRLVELGIARRNTKALLAAGGVEHGEGHYPAMVAMHAAWLVALALAVGPETPVNAWLFGAFLAIQPLRVWTMASLGRFWTTRIIVVPGAARVRGGPYRWLRHPNYVVVALELALVPAAVGLWWLAAAATLANAAMMRVRLAAENAALRQCA
jgi:methyltransferase